MSGGWYVYNYNCTNCCQLSLTSVAMSLPNSISLDEDPATSAISLHIYGLYVTEEQNPMQLKKNFLIHCPIACLFGLEHFFL